MACPNYFLEEKNLSKWKIYHSYIKLLVGYKFLTYIVERKTQVLDLLNDLS